MPLTLLDIGLLVVMAISGILAMVRGFMREILSIAAWLIAAVVTLYGFERAEALVRPYIANDLVAKGVAIGGLFLITLLVVSIFTVKISDLVLDSRIGPLDRSLGFLFGLGRGLLIMVVAFLFFAWLVPPKAQPGWVTNARSRPILQSSGEWLRSVLPEDLDKSFRRTRDPEDANPQQRSDGSAAPRLAERTESDEHGYKRGDRQGLEQLIEGTRGAPR